jgi:hypothetical protein
VEAGKRGVERIEKIWEDHEPSDPRNESFAAASLDRHDTIIRRNLGMSDNDRPMSPLNLSVLSQNTVISIAEKAPAEEPA